MSQQTDKIKTLSNANEEETEIDLLELFYYLKAKLVWLISFFVIGAVIAGLITYFLLTPKYTEPLSSTWYPLPAIPLSTCQI